MNTCFEILLWYCKAKHREITGLQTQKYSLAVVRVYKKINTVKDRISISTSY